MPYTNLVNEVADEVAALQAGSVSINAGPAAAQDILVAGATGWDRITIGSTGQRLIVRTDGTIGYVNDVISLAGWKVGANANLGNGTNDDTAAIQAWASAVIAVNGCGYMPQPAVNYKVTSTIALTPGPGRVNCVFKIKSAGTTTAITWAGPSGTDGQRQAVFLCAGWKQGTSVDGLKVRIPTATNVVAYEIDNPSTTFTSTYTAGQAAGTPLAVVTSQNLTVGQPITLSYATGNAESLTIGSIPDATHITLTAPTANAHTSGDILQSPYGSFSQNTWHDCHAFLTGNQPGVVGWRIGHSDAQTGGSDYSFLEWQNCGYDAGATTGVIGSASQIGWAFEGANCLNNCIRNGYYYGADKGVTNNVTTGATAVAGGASIFIYGMGSSGCAGYDFEFVNFGTYLISGGRFELGAQFLQAGGTTIGEPINVTVDGIEAEGYTGIGGVFASVTGSSSLRFRGYVGWQKVAGVPTQWGASMFTCSSASSSSIGTLSICDSHLSATLPFVTCTTGGYALLLKNNLQLNASNAVIAQFPNSDWLSTNSPSFNTVTFGNGSMSSSNVGGFMGIGLQPGSPGGVPRARWAFNGAVASSNGSGGRVDITDSAGGRDIAFFTGAGATPVARMRADGNFEMQSGLVRKRVRPASYPYAMLATDNYISTSTAVAGRSVTLLVANTVPTGREVIIADAIGSASVNNMAVNLGNGTDTLSLGAAGVGKSLKTNFGAVTLISDGVSNWEIANQTGTFS